MSTRLLTGVDPLSVFSGRTLLGTIEKCHGRYTACDPDGNIVGVFDRAIDAARALPERSHTPAVAS